VSPVCITCHSCAARARAVLRITPQLVGPVHILHSTNKAHCGIVNAHLMRPRQIVASLGLNESRTNPFRLRAVFTAEECEHALSCDGVCDGWNALSLSRVFCGLPASADAVTASAGAAGVPGVPAAAAAAEGVDTLMSPASSTMAAARAARDHAMSPTAASNAVVGVLPTDVDFLPDFLKSSRCDSYPNLCGGNGPRTLRRTRYPLQHESAGLIHTWCQPAVNKGLQYLDRHILQCPPGQVLSSFVMNSHECPDPSLQRRFSFGCVGLTRHTSIESAANALSSISVVDQSTECRSMFGQPIAALRSLSIACPTGAFLHQAR